MVTPQNAEPAPTFFCKPEEGPTVVDTSSPTITTIFKGKEVPRTVVDGESGVNVITQHLFDTLGI